MCPGQGCIHHFHTGRHAHLTGYDPNTTKSGRIPIGTGYIKTKAQNGVPILLKINEAPINSQSKMTLLAKCQIRDHGFIVDSVATKHNVNSKVTEEPRD